MREFGSQETLNHDRRSQTVESAEADKTVEAIETTEAGPEACRTGEDSRLAPHVLAVCSDYCQAWKKMAMRRLDHYDRREGGWLEVLIEDRHAGPAETAASRIDFSVWLETLSRRDRKIAWKLALGEATRQVARWFRVWDGRISRLRRELERSWRAFHGELAAA